MVLTSAIIPCLFDGRGFVPSRVSVMHRPASHASAASFTLVGIQFSGTEVELVSSHALGLQAGAGQNKWITDIIALSPVPVVACYWSIADAEQTRELQEVKVVFELPVEAEANT